jgi:hypothetical protein
MSAIPFINKTGRTKFHDSFTFDNMEYEYILYLLPINREMPKKEHNEIVKYFGNRMYKGKPCLKVDESIIDGYLVNKNVSAFLLVQPIGINNVASGTLQIADMCYLSEEDPKYDIWIGDVCRIASSGNEGNPLKALFFIMEQLAVQNMGKTNINLFIERDEENKRFLEERYKSLGFTLNADDNAEICPRWSYPEMVMQKPDLLPRTDIIDFSFLQVSPYGLRSHKKQRTFGGRKSKRRNKMRRKTKKYRRISRK